MRLKTVTAIEITNIIAAQPIGRIPVPVGYMINVNGWINIYKLLDMGIRMALYAHFLMLLSEDNCSEKNHKTASDKRIAVPTG